MLRVELVQRAGQNVVGNWGGNLLPAGPTDADRSIADVSYSDVSKAGAIAARVGECARRHREGDVRVKAIPSGVDCAAWCCHVANARLPRRDPLGFGAASPCAT